jgi:Winged helix-turn-helix DNA-binding
MMSSRWNRLRHGLAMRERTDQLYVRTLGSRELEALDLIEQRPGISVVELADAIGVSLQRAWQYVGRLEASRVRREPVA